MIRVALVASSFSTACDHLGDVLGCADQALGPFEAQLCAVVEESLRRRRRCTPSSDLSCCHRVANDLVVHVGDVHDVVEREAAGAQPAAQNVLKREGAEVADVHVVVDRRPARVHADGIAVHGRKLFHLLRKSVVKAHEIISLACRPLCGPRYMIEALTCVYFVVLDCCLPRFWPRCRRALR